MNTRRVLLVNKVFESFSKGKEFANLEEIGYQS